MKIKIRQIQPKDDEALSRIIRTSLKEHLLDIPGTAYFDPELDSLSAFYKDKNDRAYWVLSSNEGKIVGGAGIGPFNEDDKNIAELQKLYIAPEAQGTGLSYQLMDQVFTFAQAFGYHQVYLETHSNLQAAYHVYQNYGFKQLKEPISGTIHTTMDIYMIKDVNED